MAYTKQTWNNGSGGGTPVSAARMNYIETGIEDAAADADTAGTNASTALANAATAQSTANAAQTTANGAVAKSVMTTKGDLLVATASATPARLGVGTDGRFLEADAAQSTGLKWGRKITVSATEPPTPTVGDLWLKPVA